jgi:hypothetical protein
MQSFFTTEHKVLSLGATGGVEVLFRTFLASALDGHELLQVTIHGMSLNIN